jgi:hypothetical protein
LPQFSLPLHFHHPFSSAKNKRLRLHQNLTFPLDLKKSVSLNVYLNQKRWDSWWMIYNYDFVSKQGLLN